MLRQLTEPHIFRQIIHQLPLFKYGIFCLSCREHSLLIDDRNAWAEHAQNILEIPTQEFLAQLTKSDKYRVVCPIVEHRKQHFELLRTALIENITRQITEFTSKVCSEFSELLDTEITDAETLDLTELLPSVRGIIFYHEADFRSSTYASPYVLYRKLHDRLTFSCINCHQHILHKYKINKSCENCLLSANYKATLIHWRTGLFISQHLPCTIVAKRNSDGEITAVGIQQNNGDIGELTPEATRLFDKFIKK